MKLCGPESGREVSKKGLTLAIARQKREREELLAKEWTPPDLVNSEPHFRSAVLRMLYGKNADARL